MSESQKTSSPQQVAAIKPGGLKSSPLVIPQQMQKALNGIFSKVVRHIGDSPNAVIGVVASNPGEGATTLALKLALCAASNRRRALLIDMCPDQGLSQLLKVSNQKGVNDVAAGGLNLSEAVCPAGIEGLSVLPAGSIGAGGFTGNGHLPKVLSAARKICDLALVDLPAVEQSGLALEVLSALDGVILVVAANSTRRETVQSTKEALSICGGDRIIGAVLNDREYFVPNFLYRHI
jgi:Mrp family chromosome partitioning ATPase